MKLATQIIHWIRSDCGSAFAGARIMKNILIDKSTQILNHHLSAVSWT